MFVFCILYLENVQRLIQNVLISFAQNTNLSNLEIVVLLKDTV